MLDKIRQLAAGMDPDQAMQLLMQHLPDERRRLVAELGSTLAVLDELPIDEPTDWARQLFVRYGGAAGLSPELLASVSWTLTGYSPRGGPLGLRIGLLGVPHRYVREDQVDGIRADPAELQAGHHDAAVRVAAGVSRGASILAELSRCDGVAAGLLEYTRLEGHHEAERGDCAFRILAGTLVLAAGQLGDDSSDELEDADRRLEEAPATTGG